jgi:tetratricopeptide (TPR) repeat protein
MIREIIILLLTAVIFNGCNKPAKTSVINSPTVVIVSPTPTVVKPVSLPTVSATHVYSLEQLLNAGDSAVSNYSDLKGALNYFDRAIKTDNKCARAWYRKGDVLYGMKKYEEALKCYDRALKFNSEDSYAWEWKGRILVFNLEKYEEAIKCFDKVLKIVPEHEDTLKYMGYSLYKAAMYEKAVIYFDKTLEIDDSDFFSLYNKGNALYELKKYKEAIRCFDRASEEDHYFVIENREKALKALSEKK